MSNNGAQAAFGLFIAVILSLSVRVSGAEPQWKSVPLRLGKQKVAGLSGGEGGQIVQAIAYAQSNPDVAYLGVDTSAVWRSNDGGFSWSAKNNGFLSHGARSLIVDPVNHDVVFAAGLLGMSYDEGSTFACRLQGIYRTVDGGESWELMRQTDFYKQDAKGDLFSFAIPFHVRLLQRSRVERFCQLVSRPEHGRDDPRHEVL